MLQSLAAFVALLVAFRDGAGHCLRHKGASMSPQRRGRTGVARPWFAAAICEHQFEPEDMAHCPAYSGPICSLCCSLETRCRDLLQAASPRLEPGPYLAGEDDCPTGRFAPSTAMSDAISACSFLFGSVIGGVLSLVTSRSRSTAKCPKAALKSAL